VFVDGDESHIPSGEYLEHQLDDAVSDEVITDVAVESRD
jgi:hypothetical protein